MPVKRALVTGASRGLGRYLAGALATDGWAVTGLGLRPEGDLLSLPLDEGSESEVTYLQADLGDPATLVPLSAKLGEVPDLVVHCAVAYPPRTSGPPTPDQLQDVFRVNAFAPYLLTLGLLERKPAEQFTAVVVVNSEAVFAADKDSAPYAASKAAMRVLTTGLADVCKGTNAAVATLMLGPLSSPDKRAELRRIAEKRNLSEEEITRMFLRRSNPNLVIDTLIDYEACHRSVQYIAGLGPVGNGMVCRLDGGSAGSLI
ncbi:SDR family oxidoreductase [Streptomyces sp. NPDC056347]|uniref:SDR family oxidoreductase n=1 Tax=Streptomyces sp. NPDC056347 TaxID=3345790 RepID=UPI0035E0E3D4